MAARVFAGAGGGTAAAPRPPRTYPLPRSRNRGFSRGTHAAMVVAVVFVATCLVSTRGGHPAAASDLHPGGPPLRGLWPWGRNATKSYHRELRSITRKLMAAAFASTDKNKSGYLEFEEIVPMMHVFYFVSRLDMIDYMVEGLPDDQINATATALAQEYFQNVTEATYEEEAKAFLQKVDTDGDGRISRKEMDAVFADLFEEIDRKPVSAQQMIHHLSYFAGSLYRIGMLDGDALQETQMLQTLDKTNDPKAATAAVTAYIKALKRKKPRT